MIDCLKISVLLIVILLIIIIYISFYYKEKFQTGTGPSMTQPVGNFLIAKRDRRSDYRAVAALYNVSHYKIITDPATFNPTVLNTFSHKSLLKVVSLKKKLNHYFYKNLKQDIYYYIPYLELYHVIL